MFRSLGILAAAMLSIATFAGATLPQLAPGHSVPHWARCRGALTDVVPGSLSFAGEGVATHFGRYTEVGSNDFDDQGNILNGEFTITAADGSTTSGTYSGTYSPLPSGQIRFEVVALWLEGTGRFEGVTGQGTVVAIVDGVAPGAALEYETIGTLVMP